MTFIRRLGIASLCLNMFSMQAHAQLAKNAVPILANADLKSNPITANGASTSRTMGAMSADEITAATLAAAAIPSSKIGAASGVASLNSSSLIPSAQIPFGTTTGTVADGGVVANLQSNSGIPQTQLGAASGVAQLDSNKLIPSAQVPFGTVTGKVADGGVVTNLGTQFSNFQTSVANTYLSKGGDASANTVTTYSDTANPALISTLASNVYNIALHGAKGDAVSDGLALHAAITYATNHPWTDIYVPANLNGQPWQFTATKLFEFSIPSKTFLTGAGRKFTTFAWNDYNTGDVPAGTTCAAYEANNAHPGTTCGYYLLGNQADANGRSVDIALRGFTLAGTWTTLAPGGSNDSFAEGNAPQLFGNVDGLAFDDVESEYSRGYGFGATTSTNVSFNNVYVYYSFADGIANEGTSYLTMNHVRILHTEDDCISDHARDNDPNLLRRVILINDVVCKDTASIDIIGAFEGSLDNVVMDTPKNQAISLGTTPPGTATVPTGSNEGNDTMGAFTVSNLSVFNLLDRSSFDKYGGGNTAINIFDASSRPGNLTGIPGVATSGVSKIVDPYPQVLNHSGLPSVAVRSQFQLNFDNIHVTRTFPGQGNGTYTAPGASSPLYPNWESLGEPAIVGSTGLFNPSLGEGSLQGGCITISGGNIQGLYVDNFSCSGMGYFASITATTATSKLDDFNFSDVNAFDLSQYVIAYDIENGATLNLKVNNLNANVDPYNKYSNRGGSGNWNGLASNFAINGLPGCDEIVYCKSGTGGNVLVENGTIKNAMTETNVDTTDPNSGFVAGPGNYDYAQIGIPNVFSGNQNFGMGWVHPGFNLIPIDAIPGDALYGQSVSTKYSAAPTVPVSGTWQIGDYVKDTQPSGVYPVSGWRRLTSSNRNLLGFDWASDYISGAPPAPVVMQTVGGRNPTSGTSITLTFANTVSVNDTVLITTVGSSYNNSVGNITAPSVCQILAGQNLPNYNVAGGQAYAVWKCAPAANYTFSGMGDGGVFQGIDVANYSSVLISAAPLGAGSATLSIPVTGNYSDIRVGIAEWDGPASTSVVTTPANIMTTNYLSSGDNGYHYGFSYILSADTNASSFSAVTSYATSTPTYVQLDLVSNNAQFFETSSYTASQNNCTGLIRDDGATATHTLTIPVGLVVPCRIDLYQNSNFAWTVVGASAALKVIGATTTANAGDHRVIQLLDAVTVDVHP